MIVEAPDKNVEIVADPERDTSHLFDGDVYRARRPVPDEFVTARESVDEVPCLCCSVPGIPV